MDELILDGGLESMQPSALFAESSYWDSFAEKLGKSDLGSIAKEVLFSTSPKSQASLDSAPPTFLTASRNAYELWWRSSNRNNNLDEIGDVFQLFAMLESPYSRVRIFNDHALPLCADFDSDSERLFSVIVSAAALGDCKTLHLFLLQHVHARGFGGRLQGNLVTQGSRQQFFETVVKACSRLPPLKEILARTDSEQQLSALSDSPRGLEVLEEACKNSAERPQSWCLSMVSCGILAFSLLANNDSVMQGSTGIWLRSLLSSERTICDIVNQLSQPTIERTLKSCLLHLVADAIHVLSLVHDPRNPLLPVGSAGVSRSLSLGQSPIHVVLQLVTEDENFLRTSHHDLSSYFPYLQVLSILTTVVNADGRMRLSLCGAMLDLQRHLPAVGDGLILRILQHLMSNRSPTTGQSLPIHRHMMMMVDDRRGNAQVQQHVMDEGLIHAFAVTLLFHLESARTILDDARNLDPSLQTFEGTSGKDVGYPKFSTATCCALAPIEAMIVMVLDMCRGIIVVSQHHSTNPVAFLLTPMGNYSQPLGSTLLDFLKDFSEVSPLVTVSAMSFLSACIHHNVRDVVPPLLERGALDMILSWIHPNLAPRIRPVVRLSTAQVLQAFFVHSESRELIRRNSGNLSSIFNGLVECMDYPSSRIAMSQEVAANRDWPQKIPSEIIATCGKDFFAIARELSKAESTPLFAELCGLFSMVSPRLRSTSSWKVREALQQLVEFVSASAPNSNGGRPDRDFWARRRDDAEAVVSMEMTALRVAGLGAHLNTIINQMVANCIAAAADSDDENAQALPTSTLGSAVQAAAALSFDVLTPLLTRIDRSDFSLAVTPILKVVNDISNATRSSKQLKLSDAWTIQAILQFIIQFPEGRRCPPHVSNAKETILTNLNDVYCICMQNFRRPLNHMPPGNAASMGPGALSQLPPAPEPIAAFMGSMQKLFSSGTHQHPSLHPLGNIGGRRGMASDTLNPNSVERAVETIEAQLTKWRDDRSIEGLSDSLLSVVVQLQATQSMLTPTPTNLRSPPAPLMVSTRLTELVRLLRSLVEVLPGIQAAKLSNADPVSPTAANGPPTSANLDACVLDALELIFSISKIAVSGHRLVARDNDRRRDICLIVSLYFEYFAAAKYVTKKILTSVLQLLSIAARGALFATPPSQSTANFGSTPRPHRRDADPWGRTAFEPLSEQLDLDSHDIATENLRNHVLEWLTDAMGPLYAYCEEVDAASSRTGRQNHEVVPGHQGISGSALDLELRRAASQILFAAIGSPHFREIAVDVIARNVQKDFDTYCPLLHLLAVCIAQKGNLNLRRGIASMTSLSSFLMNRLGLLREQLRSLQQTSSTVANVTTTPSSGEGFPPSTFSVSPPSPGLAGAPIPASTPLRQELRRMEYILTVFHSLQTPPSPSSRHHQIVERICEHYQNGFCWHGPECPNAHADAPMHMRATLEATDLRLIDAIRAVFPLPSSDAPKNLSLDTPSFVGGLGVSLLRPADASALLSELAGCLEMLSKEQTRPSSAFATVPLQFPVRDHASVVFQACVRVAVLQIQLDQDRSKATLHAVPLEVYAAFDRELPGSHRSLVAHLVRYALEDSFASDALMYRCLTRIASEQIQEDKGRFTLIQQLLPEQQAVLEQKAAVESQSSWHGHASTMFSQHSSVAPQETPGGLRPATPPPPPLLCGGGEGDDKQRAIQSFLFPLSEVLLDFTNTGSKFIVAASRAVSAYCVPVVAPTGPNNRPRKGYIWIAPHHQSSSSTPTHHAKHYRAIAKQFLREIMTLYQRRTISTDFVVALLSECASLPHVQLAAFSRQKHSGDDVSAHQRGGGRSILLQLMGQFQNPKMAAFLWSVTMRHPKLAVAEWVRSLNDELTARGQAVERGDGWQQDRWSLDGLLLGIESILRHNPHSRERVVKELSAPEVVSALCNIVSHTGTLQRTAGLALLFIFSLLKIRPPSAATANTHDDPHQLPAATARMEGQALSSAFEDALDQLVPDPNADHVEHHDDDAVDDDEVVYEEHHDEQSLADVEASEARPLNEGRATAEVDDDDNDDEEGGDDDNEDDNDDDDDDDNDDDDGEGDNPFAEDAFDPNRTAFNPDQFAMDDDEDDFRIIGRDGEQIEVRIAAGGGAHSLIVRGGREDHDPDFIRELLFRAHMADFGGAPGAGLSSGGGLQRFLRRHEQRATPSFAVNPEESATVFWHSALGMGRVLSLPGPPPAAPAARDISPSPDLVAARRVEQSRRGTDVGADALIMELFGGSTRTPSNQATNQTTTSSQTQHQVPMVLPPSQLYPGSMPASGEFTRRDSPSMFDEEDMNPRWNRDERYQSRMFPGAAARFMGSPRFESPMSPFSIPPPPQYYDRPHGMPRLGLLPRPAAPAPPSPSSPQADDETFVRPPPTPTSTGAYHADPTADSSILQPSDVSAPASVAAAPPAAEEVVMASASVTDSGAAAVSDPLPWEGSLDPQFLAELPPEVRQDILLEHFPILTIPGTHTVDGRATHLHPLFLAALPSDLQEEILALESRVSAVSAPAQPVAVPDPSPPASETIMLLALIGEPDIRRDILLTCELNELVADAALHAEAVRLRAERDAAQQAARQAQQLREEMARQEAHARMLEAQRRAAHQRENVHLRRFGRDDDDVFPLRARERTLHRTGTERTMAAPSGWASLRASPISPAVAVELCRFVDSSSATSAALLSRILSSVLEGAPYDEIHASLHHLLDFATQPLAAKVAEQLSRASAEATTSSNSNRSHRPNVARSATRLRQGDEPPAAFVTQILGILASLVAKCRSVGMALLVLPSDHQPLPNGDHGAVLPADAKESDEGAYSEFVFRALSEAERAQLQHLPFARIIELLESRRDAPEVADAVDAVLSPLVQLMNALESDAGGVTQERLNTRLPPLRETPTAPVMQHPRHVHQIQWSDTLQDSRYQSRAYQCNLCRVTSHFWAYRCAACHFDLCPGCALDHVSAATQKARISRWGYWVVAATPLLSMCASILSKNVCKERTAVRVVCLLSRGIRLCSHSAAPTDDALCELEMILCKHAKDLMGGIRDAVRRIEDIQLTLRRVTVVPVALASQPAATGSAAATHPSAQQISAMDATAAARRKDSLISKALMLMELPEELMRNVYLLFLPYAETQRSQLRSEIRLMFHASRLYLAEISNLLAQHPNRLRAVLPAAAFPLLNGYAQFHLLYGSGDGTESMSMAERSETERLLSEKQTDVSAVSDSAWEAVQASQRAAAAAANNRGDQQQHQRDAAEDREALPHHIYKFCEANRTLINTLIHWDPTLLDEGLKFITRAPRLVDLDFKLKNFRKSFNRSRHRMQQHSITVSRANVFQDSFKAIKDLPEPCPIHVRFQGEEGSDAGGLVREWFQVLGEEMVNDNYALFVHSSEGMTYQPNPCSGVNANHLEYFRFCGMIVGLAVYNDISMDVHFTRSVYRHMIGAEPCFRDVETMDPMMYTNLEKLLALDIAPEMNLDFTVTFERFGKTEEAELVPNGANVLVTNENKKEYIRLRSAFIMTQQIEAQLREFLIGFYKMVPRKEVQTFTEQELELVISGLPDIDVEDLRLNTEYSGYSGATPVIRWFWEIVSSMTRQDRANLLQFATGSSKVPLGGFSNLESGGHRHRFSITKTDTPIELLPSAHTCFNRIDLPEYTTAEMLREKLMIAITYGNKGFTMV